jgi:glycosyltransferase involved in cell wall biosynthesis
MPTESSPRRLLHVFSGFGVGGPEVRFTTVANRFGRKYQHGIIAMDGNFDCAARLDPALDVELIRIPVAKGRVISLGNLRRFAAILGERRPDTLLTYGWGALEWALAHRLRSVCRHVHFEDGFGPEESDGRQIPRRLWFRRMAMAGQTQVVVPSHVLDRIATEVWQIQRARVTFVPNGVDCERYRPGGDVRESMSGSPLPSLALETGTVLVGTVAALRPEKNVARLLRVMARLPGDIRAVAVVVGNGPERPELERLASAVGLGDRVVFTGAMMRPECVLNRLDVYTVPSDTEQMPISLLEAMAAGLPVVGTDVGDVRTMVADSNRDFIVPVNDEAAFADRLAALIRDPARRRALGDANRERVIRNYHIDAMVAAYDRLFGG